MVGPWQFLPPHRGAGLSQDLERHEQELTPSAPSSLLQGCHGDHGPKPPLAVWFRSWEPEGGWVKIGAVRRPGRVICAAARVASAGHLTPTRRYRVNLHPTGQTVMFCFHWLMLELSSRVVHRRCLKSQPQ